MHVARVGFAPVKGTRHPAYDRVTLAEHGPVGDRAFCLVDVAGRRVLKTVQNPSLVAIRSAWDGAVLSMVLPSGEVACSAPEPTGEELVCDYWGRPATLALLAGPHAALASSYLGADVRLAAAPPGQVVYGAPVTLVSLASLRSLADSLGRPELAREPARFRPTIVVDDLEPWAEESWVGRTVRLGDATVRVNALVPRCAVIDLDPVTGVPSAPVLKALADRPAPAADGTPELPFGVDAFVVAPGAVRPGDPVLVD
ncbi:MOSC domain-containing protein [Nocardioides panaciterrulae]|uniref:MOSC domain-containing protein n=1 Tax=Nocardioides panaciterrulae TaxID=661492 RepID=A0A7Y9E949_9ACTN|nr:MOSC domain-containing protein [Nocardioides panaciterrulae]NYD43171.1 hypothetical protein [Nocardioides panaciterrulae]